MDLVLVQGSLHVVDCVMSLMDHESFLHNLDYMQVLAMLSCLIRLSEHEV
jgi:hypothetical protein